MKRILISACLFGRPVRYDGQAKTLIDPRLGKWRDEGRLVSICPEQAGGLSTPRLPAEIEDGSCGADVLTGRATVIDSAGMDVSAAFISGAKAALSLAQETGCAYALLIDGSPSCGSAEIYDGSFSGLKHVGEGVTAALLRQNGIVIFSQGELDALDQAVSLDN